MGYAHPSVPAHAPAQRQADPDVGSRNAAPSVDGGLRVGAVDDRAEIEADRLADAVVGALNSAGPVTPTTTRIARSATGAPVVRRKMAFTSKSFKSGTSLAADVKGVFGSKSTFAQVLETLDRYHRTKDPTEELYLLRAIDGLCAKWMGEHTGKHDDPKKRQELSGLRVQVGGEITRMETAAAPAMPATNVQQQTAYMAKLDETRKDTGLGFQYLTGTGLETADWMRAAAEPDPKKAPPMPPMVTGVPKAHRDERNKAFGDVMAANPLTPAEATAIGIYTGQDYMYINPTVAGNDAWLESQLKSDGLGVRNETTRKVLEQAKNDGASLDTEKNFAKTEGMEHADIVMQGLAKLPKFAAETFRGKSVTPAELKSLSKTGATWKESGFASTSTRREKAEEFAMKVSGGKVGVLMVLKLRNGRDVSALSFTDEAEVLVLPGATFRVTKVTTEKVGAKKLTLVHADQVT